METASSQRGDLPFLQAEGDFTDGRQRERQRGLITVNQELSKIFPWNTFLKVNPREKKRKKETTATTTKPEEGLAIKW